MVMVLDDALKKLKLSGYVCVENTIFDVGLYNKPVCTINVEDKFVYFYEEYLQIAYLIPILDVFLKDLVKRGFSHNHHSTNIEVK